MLGMPCASAAAAGSSQLPSPVLETGDKWMKKKAAAWLKPQGNSVAWGLQCAVAKLCLHEPGTGWSGRSELRDPAPGEGSWRDAGCMRNQKDQG